MEGRPAAPLPQVRARLHIADILLEHTYNALEAKTHADRAHLVRRGARHAGTNELEAAHSDHGVSCADHVTYKHSFAASGGRLQPSRGACGAGWRMCRAGAAAPCARERRSCRCAFSLKLACLDRQHAGLLPRAAPSLYNRRHRGKADAAAHAAHPGAAQALERGLEACGKEDETFKMRDVAEWRCRLSLQACRAHLAPCDAKSEASASRAADLAGAAAAEMERAGHTDLAALARVHAAQAALVAGELADAAGHLTSASDLLASSPVGSAAIKAHVELVQRRAGRAGRWP